MKQLRTIALLAVASCAVSGMSGIALASTQSNAEQYWQRQLAKARGALARNAKSSFWHGQAGIAYDGLGDVSNAQKQLKLAAKLDPTNPMNDYILYAFYQRRGTFSQQRQALLDALAIDLKNPLGHFELGTVLEKEEYLSDALREYRTAEHLVANVKGDEYKDPRRNPYQIGIVRRNVNGAIDRVENKMRGDNKARRF